jgi:hypothetical protein
MTNPNLPSAIADKAREARLWVAAVLAGAVAVAGAASGAAATAQAESAATGSQPEMVLNFAGAASGAAATAQAESAATGSQPEMVLNFAGTNPYNQSAEQLQRIADNLQKDCHGVFEPAACVPPGFSTNLLNHAMIAFTPLVTVPGAPEVSFTNNTFTQIPTYAADPTNKG